MGGRYALVPTRVLFDREVGAAAKLVYAALCSYANADDLAWPRLELLADNLGVSKSAVSHSTRRLAAAGHISIHHVVRHGKRVCLYRVRGVTPVAVAVERISDAEWAAGLDGEELSSAQQGGGGVDVSSTPKLTSAQLPSYEQTIGTDQTTLTDTPKPPAVSREQHVVDTWNAMAADAGLPKARATDKRTAVIRTRLRDGDWLADFVAACAVVAASAWHKGDNPSRWVATIDYLLQRGKATELAERAKATPVDAPKSRSGARAGVDAAHLEQLRKNPALGTLQPPDDVSDDLADVFQS
jgi:hypothetical protein